MNAKIFYLRLTKENLQQDENKLNEFLETVTIKKIATDFISGQTNFWTILLFFEEKTSGQDISSSDKSKDINLTKDAKILYKSLQQWRTEKARQMSVPSFIIMNNISLTEIAKLKPQTIADLLKITGIGESKTAKYGTEILSIIKTV